MKVIIDLMEAYSDHVGLPFLLINLNGEVDYKADKNNCLASFNASNKHLMQLRDVAVQLNSPTMMSISDEGYDIFHLITPKFYIGDCSYFFAAGPFLIDSSHPVKQNYTNSPLLKKIDETVIEESISKMRNLYLLLVNRTVIGTKSSLPQEIISVIQMLGDMDCDISNYNEYLKQLINELNKIDSFDFLGLALKNENDVFTIHHICGEGVQQLADKRFYIGEGLLGNAVILGEDFTWSKGVDTKRNEFLNRHNIYPNHFFGFTIKEKNIVDAVLFGGSFKDEPIADTIMKLLLCIVRFVSQRKNISAQLSESNHMQSVFSSWLDLMNITTKITDKKNVIYKILDFCHTMNNGQFTCFTSSNEDFMYRGNTNKDIKELHQRQCVHASIKDVDKMWEDKNCIHFNVAFNGEYYGLLTVAFNKRANLQQATLLYDILNRLLNQKPLSKSEASPENTSIFQVLHSSMREMNKNLFEEAQLAVEVAKKLTEVCLITAERKRHILNLCSVLPYELEYLKVQIAQTEEVELLDLLQCLLYQADCSDDETIEVKILVFIYKVVIDKVAPDQLDFLSPQLKQLFMGIYEALLKTKQAYNLEMNDDQIDEIMDLHSVIETLALTSREKEILYLILEGLNNQELGQYLNISVHTVKNHVTNIFKKLNVSDRIQAMTKIYRIKYGDV